MSIFLEYTDLVEPLSLDEAFLDVTTNHKGMKSATLIAKEIRERIYEETKLTASAGISFNKFLAKIASDCNKPNGMFVIKPNQAEAFVESLEIERFFGVGKVTAKKMHQLGIKTGLDLKSRSELELVTHFGKMGSLYFQNARGLDDRIVNPDRIRKSVGAETTFDRDIDDYKELSVYLKEVAEDVIKRIEKAKFKGKTLTLKLKYADFKILSRSKTVVNPITDYDVLFQLAEDMLLAIDITPKVRLIGLSLKNNIDDNWADAMQLSFDFKEY